jgi:hypothetical protein
MPVNRVLYEMPGGHGLCQNDSEERDLKRYWADAKTIASFIIISEGRNAVTDFGVQ